MRAVQYLKVPVLACNTVTIIIIELLLLLLLLGVAWRDAAWRGVA